MEYQRDLDDASSSIQELERVFRNVKRRKPKNLDQVFNQAHEKAFQRIDCLNCANCCKTTSPIFRDVDVQRIAKTFKQSAKEFEIRFLKRDEDNDLVLQQSPCPFLGEDNKCFIYDIRPQACREYPHTNRKRMIQILDLTLKNSTICPAVSEISLFVKKKFE